MKTEDKRIRIAVLIRNFIKSDGGAERYCYEVTKEISNKYNVTVFCQTKKSNLDSVAFIKVPKWFNRPRFLNQLLFSFFTRRLLTNHDFQIIHSHDMVSHANVHTLHVPCFKKQENGGRFSSFLKKILSLLSPRKLSYLWLENKMMNENKSIIAVSSLLSNNIKSTYPNIKKVNIAYPGISLHKINSSRPLFSNDKIRILFIGHGFLRKGLQEIILAVESLNSDSVEIFVAGRGSKKEIQFNSDIVKENTHFLGQVDNIWDLYNSGDIIIHPSKGDTFGMVALEAMASNRVVLISNHRYCGISELLSDEEAFILKNPSSHEEIANTLKNIIKNKNKSIGVAINGLKFAKKMTWKKTATQTEKAYLEILKMN